MAHCLATIARFRARSPSPPLAHFTVLRRRIFLAAVRSFSISTRVARRNVLERKGAQIPFSCRELRDESIPLFYS